MIIRLTNKPDAVKEVYDSVEIAGKVDNRYAMPDETGLFVVICRGRKTSLIADWPQFKNYN